MTLEPLFLGSLSVIPQDNRVEALHEAYKLKFLTSLIELIICAENAFAKNYSSIINKLSTIKKNLPKYFSPWLYNLYFQLLDFMEKDNISEVKKIISILNNADESLYLLHSQRIQPGLIEDWECQVFKEEVQVSFGSNILEVYSPTASEVDLFQLCVARSMKLIAAVEPLFIKEINSLISTILLVNSPGNVGATSPKFFGTIYISLPQGDLEKHHDLLLVDHLVHETSHLYLNSIIAHDPLVLNDPQEQFSSPIREDLRPILGIYHATFVLSRVIRVLKKIHSTDLYQDNSFVMRCINNLQTSYEIAYTTVKTHAVLTKIGREIFESTRECAFLDTQDKLDEVEL